MMHSSILKGWVGRGALSLALLAGAVAVFLMMGGLGEGQQACPAGVDDCVEYPEHGSGTVIAFTAVDPEGEPVAWSVSWTDSGFFDIEEGRLTFKTPPDYEGPQDSGRDNVYEVIVTATTDRTVNNPTTTTTRRVDVRVMDLDEPGTISLTTVQPKEDVALTATLADPDLGPSDVTWQWSRSARASGPWTDIDRSDTAVADDTAMKSVYTPGYEPEDAPG